MKSSYMVEFYDSNDDLLDVSEDFLTVRAAKAEAHQKLKAAEDGPHSARIIQKTDVLDLQKKTSVVIKATVL